MSNEIKTISLNEHSWSDTSVDYSNGINVMISIRNQATEETQTEWEKKASGVARLIAKAPEMLEFIKNLLDYPLAELDCCEVKSIQESAKQLIAEAEGGAE